MSDEVIVALVAAGASVIGTLLVTLSQRRKDSVEAAARRQEQKDRLDRIDEKMARLEKKIDVHNGYAQKFGETEKAMTVIQKDVEYLRKEVNNLAGAVDILGQM